ncbi:MAG: metallophosphoesterase, partial [Acidobacteria bacterium]|nr:metallophosphoesterase [Candidatus Sulfomarinibacter sp. MAG AM1]
MTQQIRALMLAAVMLTASGAVAGERIVAVGDIHGNFDGLVSILQRAELIDAETHWIGGGATLVQTGDIFDRGLYVREVLDLLMRLQGEAESAGGRVVVLLGNHEGMNLTGFFRDVNPEIYEAFADDKSEKRRKEGYRSFKKYWRERAKAEGVEPPVFTSEVESKWMT